LGADLTRGVANADLARAVRTPTPHLAGSEQDASVRSGAEVDDAIATGAVEASVTNRAARSTGAAVVTIRLGIAAARVRVVIFYPEDDRACPQREQKDRKAGGSV